VGVGALVEARRTRRWVQTFPGEETRTDEILPAFLGGGLLNPIKRTLGTTAQVSFQGVAAALRADADVLRDGLPGERDGLDLRREAIWEAADEGQAALNAEKARVREALNPRNVHRAGWEE
jgi:hypothetical protein